MPTAWSGHAALAACRSAAIPGLFVLLWSTGFIGAKLGLPDAEPMTFLALRFAIVAMVLGVVSLATRAPWPHSPRQILHLVVVGVLIHGIYLGGVFTSIAHGVEAGASAVIVSLQPLLVATLGALALGERSASRQWLGLALGLAGVVLVVAQKLEAGLGTPLGVGLSVLALLGMTAGTLYQKRYCGAMDLRSGSAIQFAVATVFCLIVALSVENLHVAWTGRFVLALGWLVVVLSLGAISLLFLLIRRGEATRVSSLFFLVPSSTALIAWLLFDERMSALSLLGMLLSMIGVALVNLPPRAVRAAAPRAGA